MSESRASPTNGANTKVGRNLPSWMSLQMRKMMEAKHLNKLNHVANHLLPRNMKAAKNLLHQVWLLQTSPNFWKVWYLYCQDLLIQNAVHYDLRHWRWEQNINRIGTPIAPSWFVHFQTPQSFDKLRQQVEADCGTIVSKDWIYVCYNQRKLVDIEIYLIHAGKPWRRQNGSSQDLESSMSKKSQIQIDRRSHAASTKSGASNPVKECFSPSKVKKWAIDDFNETVSWLESQEEKLKKWKMEIHIVEQQEEHLWKLYSSRPKHMEELMQTPA